MFYPVAWRTHGRWSKIHLFQELDLVAAQDQMRVGSFPVACGRTVPDAWDVDESSSWAPHGEVCRRCEKAARGHIVANAGSTPPGWTQLR